MMYKLTILPGWESASVDPKSALLVQGSQQSLCRVECGGDAGERELYYQQYIISSYV